MNERAEIVQASTGIASAVMDTALALILIAIIRRLHHNQMAHHRRQVADGT